MRFLTQDLRSGELRATEGPTPALPSGGLLVRSAASLVSAGTERMLVDFGRANLVEKARQQPDRVRQVVDKARSEGIAETFDAVRSKLAQPLPLGYANAGIVVAVGSGTRGFAVGDLVASNGPHAELVAVPATLAAKAPPGVSPEQACFASVAAVGLEAIRLAGCQLGERFVVSGLGLIGLLTVQLLRAQGCQVLGVDPDGERRRLAEALGARTAPPGDGAETAAVELSGGRGVDGVLVCASTSSSEPVRSAARMCRQRGRIVLVGVTGLELDRSELYEKELSFQVSRSYGPGRYDESYEAGHDYPFGLVRWTAGRNMEAVLDLVADGVLDVGLLVTHRFRFDDAPRAYDTLVGDPTALGIVLSYPSDQPAPTDPVPAAAATRPTGHATTPGGSVLIGAGNFAVRTLLPAIRDAGGTVTWVASRRGTDAALAAATVDARATTDVDAVLEDAAVGSVFIATRHDSHARLALAALQAGKAVYVEKPLALDHVELDELVAAAGELGDRLPVLAVGFNRRFAPISVRMRQLLADVAAPKAVIITVNAGAVAADHWAHDPAVGGGRILGEACHFVDLSRYLVGQPITGVTTHRLGRTPTDDSATIQLDFADGSMATIHYLANGSPRHPKERVEVFTQGRILRNDNFRRLRAYGWPGRRGLRGRRQDKGHVASVRAFLDAAAGRAPVAVPLDELVEVSRAAIRAATP